MHPTTLPRPSAPVLMRAALRPDHHLWRNGRVWWIAIVILDERGRHFRLRRSLATADVAVARARRDRFLARLLETPHLRPSAPGVAAALDARGRDGRGSTTRSEGTSPVGPTRRVA